MSSFTPARHPAFRLLVPFAIGIAVGCEHGNAVGAAIIASIGITLYFIISRLAISSQRLIKFRPFWIIPVLTIAFSLGMATAIIHRPAELNLAELNGKALEAEINEISHKDFSTSFTATLQVAGHPQILLSTRGCDYTITEGDVVMFLGDLKPIANLGNPDEPDYAAIMWRKGIRYSQHLSSKQDHSYRSQQRRFTFHALRHRLENLILAHIDAPEAQRLVIAMLLGDSRIIDDETRNEFSKAGIAHVLALSGLHVGIIAWIVWLVLMPLDYWRLKKLRLILTIIAIAAFCALTGFSPSVIRASLMIGISFIAFIFYKRYPPLNATAVAAILILLFQPFQLFSIGFQLSFITVTALIVTFSRWQIPVSNPLLRYVLATLATSLVAMLATAMLTAYYFHTVSFIAPIANLMVLPLVPVVIVLALILLTTALMGMHSDFITWLTEAVCHAIHSSVELLGSLPGSHITNIYMGSATLLLYLAGLALTAWWILRPRKRTALAAIIAVAAMVASHIITIAKTPAAGIVVFNNFSYTPILAFDHGNALLWVPDADDAPDELTQYFTQHHKAFMAHYRISDIAATTTSDASCTDRIVAKPPMAWIMGQSIAVADNRHDTCIIRNSTMDFDIMVVGKHLKADALPDAAAKTIVVSGARRDSISALNHKANVHHLASEGAFMLLFNR